MEQQFELYPPPRPATRKDDYKTSEQAADALAPVTGKIALAVLEFAEKRGMFGFTDDELKQAFPDAPESSYRKRRTELAQRGYLIDTMGTRENRHGRQEIIWRVRAA